jgi:bifunctional non-homologous end joining protein LigD
MKKSAADLIDEQLLRYRCMRDFKVTREPSGGAATKLRSKTGKARQKTESSLPFVIQKHAASHLHYDFRLGWNGVLKSWAVAKGPSYNPKDKRLAVQVEDHPMEYGGFEGVIPKGQYGGGTVMLWDTGTWEPQAEQADVDAGLRDGSLKFTMHGEKMKGNWALVRMGGKPAKASKPNWLLIKEHDSFGRSSTDSSIVDQAPDSVITKRSLEEIAREEDHVWNSKDGNRDPVRQRPGPFKNGGKTATQTTTRGTAKPSAVVANLDNFPKEKLPSFIAPQFAQQADKAVDREGWLHELKLDGYRIQARKDGDKVQLLTRSGLDWTDRMKAIAVEVAKLSAQSAILDGEVVVLAENGTTSFADLQAAFKDGEKHTLTYFVFDMMHLNGRNLRGAELIVRKGMLASLLEASAHSAEMVRLSEHIETEGSVVFRNACDLNAEGIISKRAASPYKSGRSSDWIKVKCIYDQEFVIGGFTLPSNGTHGVGALLLGYYDEAGSLIYAGRTGTGFTRKAHRMLRDSLEKLRERVSPFAQIPADAKRGAVWVKPDLVAQVRFATWTADNLVRQASFQGLREDKSASEVRKEGVSTPAAKTMKTAVANVAKQTRSANEFSPQKRPVAKKQDPVHHAAIRLTHPDKVLDKESGLTKQQLADYYWDIAEHMLLQIANRPISLVRCTEGTAEPCFFQRHSNAMLPAGIETVQVADKKSGKLEPYITLATRESLATLAQMGVLEVHPWGSQNDDLERPDRIIFDLDPHESIPWKTLAESADETRILLKKSGLESFLKSTGGKGLHVVAPLTPEHTWPVIKQFAHAVAMQLQTQNPSLYLTKMSKAERKGKIFVDYLRNERGATAVAAFSPRARAGVPASLPLRWAELKEPERPHFLVSNFSSWKARLSQDPWKKMTAVRQKLEPERVGNGGVSRSGL